MQQCLNQATLLPCDCETFIRTAHLAGFRAVELRSGKIEEYLCNRSYKRLRECLRAHQMEVVALDGLELFSLVPEDNEFFLVSRAQWQLQLCELFDIGTLVLVPGVLPDGKDEGQAIVEHARRNLAVIAALAERRGVRLALEIVGNAQFSIRTVRRALQVIAGTDAKRIGLALDTICLHEGYNQTSELGDIPADRIAVVHVNDAPERLVREYKLEERLMPGAGVLDLATFFGVLREKLYRGPISVEVFNEELWKKQPAEAAQEAWRCLHPYIGT